MIREPIVAGKFYPANPDILKKQLNSFIKETTQENALACILPHAGYIYSGKVAFQTAASVQIKENIILLGPNHTGLGNIFSIVSEGTWKTPLGDVQINSTIAENLKKECSLIKEDNTAHAYEHSLEVELPILQFLCKDKFSIVPLVLMSSTKSDYEKIAQAIFKTISDLNIKDKTLIIASTDMTHYEPYDEAMKKDDLALEAIKNLDEDLLLERIAKYNITMCGYVPVIITILATKKMGAKNVKVVKYHTSGETSGDFESVVGYAGITIS